MTTAAPEERTVELIDLASERLVFLLPLPPDHFPKLNCRFVDAETGLDTYGLRIMADTKAPFDPEPYVAGFNASGAMYRGLYKNFVIHNLPEALAAAKNGCGRTTFSIDYNVGFGDYRADWVHHSDGILLWRASRTTTLLG